MVQWPDGRDREAAPTKAGGQWISIAVTVRSFDPTLQSAYSYRGGLGRGDLDPTEKGVDCVLKPTLRSSGARALTYFHSIDMPLLRSGELQSIEGAGAGMAEQDAPPTDWVEAELGRLAFLLAW